VIAGAFLILIVIGVYRSLNAKAETAAPVTSVHKEVSVQRTAAPERDTGQAFQPSDVYRTIIDNNLFRPLGWRETRPIEPYCLIGTLLPLDATTGNTAHLVTLGEKIDDHTKVVSIEHKQVVLETDRKQRTVGMSIGFQK